MTELVGGSHDVGKRLATVKAQGYRGMHSLPRRDVSERRAACDAPTRGVAWIHKRALERFRTLMK